jgi:glutathione synthase/RimK-type ligase-like ATP-grasp enzyme
MNILILTELGDTHAYAVAEALDRKGARVTLWHTADFPTIAEESILFENGRKAVSVRGPALDLDDFRFDTVWHRRPCFVLDSGRLHPADLEFVDMECGIFRRSLFGLIAPGALWVNDPDAATRAGRKPVQQSIAIDVGLATPATLFSNDPREIRRFLQRYGGQIVYKTFRGVSWRDDETCWTPYTSSITEESLVEEPLLRAVPGIYQELVPKDYELRITVIGHQVLGAKVLSQQTETGRLDWRRSYHELKIEPYEVPPQLAGCCRQVLARLGLVFGCFDFIVTPEGEFVFLEVNEGGQFLFLESYSGLPLLDAFAELLMQGRPDFDWQPDRPGIRYQELHGTVREIHAARARMHVRPPDRSVRETSDTGIAQVLDGQLPA